MSMTDETRELIERRREVENAVRARIRRSITSAAADGRTVSDPDAAAEYATNALLHSDEGKALLRRAAATFAAEAPS